MNRKIGVILSYLLMMGEILSAFLFTPYLLRTLGQAEYGVYQLVLSFSAYLLLLDLGIGNSVVRYIAKYRSGNQREEQRIFLGISSSYYLSIALLILVCGLIFNGYFTAIFAHGLSPEEISKAQALFAITIITIAVTLGSSAFYNTIIGYEKFVISKGIPCLFILVRIGVSILVLALGFGSVGLVSVNLALTVITRGFMVLYVIFKLKIIPRLCGAKYSLIFEIISYSSLIFLQMIATQMNSMADRILIGILSASAAATIAVYSVGALICQYVQSIGSSVTGVLMPGIVALVERGADSKQLQIEMVRIGRLILAVLALIWVVFIFNGREFIQVWAGSNYRQSYIVAVFLITPYVLILSMSVGTQILWAQNQHRKQTYYKLFFSVASLVLNGFLISWYGLYGAAIGTFLALVTSDIVTMIIVFKQDIGISLKEYFQGLFQGIVGSLILSMITGGVIYFLPLPAFVKFFLSCVLMSLAYLSAMYFRGMTPYEKQLTLNILQHVKRRLYSQKIKH